MELLPLLGDCKLLSPWVEIRNSSLWLLGLELALHFHLSWQCWTGSNLVCKAKTPRRLLETLQHQSCKGYCVAVSASQDTNRA